ncbi:MAG: radical SAM protein [Proteobacteria bacterium]|nr:radical SAM protein [Pseudomonadota bacterium]
MSDRSVQRTREILESERGAVKKEWGGKIPICLIYPNHYYVGMSNLGFQTIYGLLNNHPGIVCERAFLPTRQELEVLQRRKRPLLSLESRRPLNDFEILAFSISFENDFINLLTILDLARIRPESSERRDRDPLIVAGGVATFLNPEPLADFIDVFLLGEAEEVLQEFMERYDEARRARTNREEFLHGLVNLEGVYVPRFYEPLYDSDGLIREVSVSSPAPKRVKRRFVKDVNSFLTSSVIITPNTEFADMTLLEVNRGCARGCLFCSACFLYRPFRNRSLEALTAAAEEGLSKGIRIGLTGAAVSDHPDLESLCDFITAARGQFSLSSVRLDRVTERLGRSLRMAELKTVALAPEAGSERLRTLMHKGIKEEDIFRAVEILLKNGVPNLRLYFLIGIPTETEEDLEAIVQLTRRIKRRMLQSVKNTRRLGKITLSINGLVPKPGTPFQWIPFETVGSLQRKLKAIKNDLRREPNVEVTHDVPKWAYIQSLLSRGDRRVGKILLAVHHNGGNWKRAFREINVNPNFYVYRERTRQELFPWDFIDHGVSKDRLWTQYVRAVKR